MNIFWSVGKAISATISPGNRMFVASRITQQADYYHLRSSSTTNSERPPSASFASASTAFSECQAYREVADCGLVSPLSLLMRAMCSTLNRGSKVPSYTSSCIYSTADVDRSRIPP
ncbi:hypothetical protein J6590_071583 [Homalodisca vitripennis]|nr:hypothetical protein J6590_071583 [Homalodisca vitripennis]